MNSTSKKRNSPMLHTNYRDAKHKPSWLRMYNQTPARSCKWCGADPKDIVVYDMPLKNGKRVKVSRCTVCDNLIHIGSVKERARYNA